jgi:hypothetical protein
MTYSQLLPAKISKILQTEPQIAIFLVNSTFLSTTKRYSLALYSSSLIIYLVHFQYFSIKNAVTPPFAVFPPFPCVCQLKGITLQSVHELRF